MIDLAATTHDALPGLIATIKGYGKRVLAEKIDTREVMQRCHDLGCDYFQGYYFAKPVIIAGPRRCQIGRGIGRVQITPALEWFALHRADPDQ